MDLLILTFVLDVIGSQFVALLRCWCGFIEYDICNQINSLLNFQIISWITLLLCPYSIWFSLIMIIIKFPIDYIQLVYQSKKPKES